ncbi:DUF803-domain-containing protein [Cylindrobasidium torrendii FP15055 ss-10]|uniref:DUF803-domain-containing protein n=1 Tax=Cylindrobasidium torrendii FP15055 ss-10 TaxID=1314674 RepID=A0A0D7BCJ6_9AGAR|nr:DUF803-domain-containing protein [Cylindrobasidium torrendii FP15055 ss-10]
MSSTSATASASASLSASASASAAAGTSSNGSLKIVGIILAITSGVLIGCSFVFKKKGLLRSQAGGVAGEGVAYLKSFLWWTGMIMMILGELCNAVAYAFTEAIVVTPLGALTVVISAILSSIFLKEKLSLFGWLGCVLCILGSVIIALNGPAEETVGKINEFRSLFIAPGFLTYISVLIVASLVIIFYFAPKYGTKSMLWYIMVCSMIGGISVSVTTGLGAAIITTAKGDNQFKEWFMYFLIGFVIVTLVTEVFYLNKALALFNTAMVTPTYYVIFTFFSMLTTIVLFQGLKAEPSEIITLVMGFLVICVGITILQLSKIDPKDLPKQLDRRSTLMLAQSQPKPLEADGRDDEEKSMLAMEDPGMDALRGGFGAVGSIIRARTASRRMSQSSRVSGGGGGSVFRGRERPPGAAPPYDPNTHSWLSGVGGGGTAHQAGRPSFDGLQRHQLYDAPVRGSTGSFGALSAGEGGEGRGSMVSDSGATVGMERESGPGGRTLSMASSVTSKKPTIKFGSTELVHSYHPTGAGRGRDDREAVHEARPVQGYPPLPNTARADVSSEVFPRGRTTSSSGESTITRPNWLDASPPRGSLDGRFTMPVPSGIQLEHTVHSAPPLRTTRPVVGRVDSRDVFMQPSPEMEMETPSGESLMSFPSVTEFPDVPGSNSSTITPTSHRGEEHGGRGRQAKRYPKGAGDDDRDESVSLWRGRAGGSSSSGEGSSEEGGESEEERRRGVRLVKPGGDDRL